MLSTRAQPIPPPLPVSLLAAGLQVRKALPVHQILGAGYTGGRRGGGEVSLGRMILALHAENAVDPAVLMGGQAHVINVGGRLPPFRHGDGAGPESEMVHAVGAFRHRKEGFAVGALHTGHQHIFALPFDGARIERGMDAEAFHQVGIRLFVKVVTPFQRSVLRREDRILVALINAVALDGGIRPFNEPLVSGLEPGESFLVGHSNTISSFSLNSRKSAAPSNPSQGA